MGQTEEIPPVLDVLGREIKVGDYVAHATMRGDSCLLKISKVLAFQRAKDSWGDPAKQPIRVKVWGVEPAYNYQRKDGINWHLGEKAGFITNSERVVVLDILQIPEEVYKLLGGK